MARGRLLKNHRIRATVYHFGAILFLIMTFIYYNSMESVVVTWYEIFCIAYFVFDYLAEMFDPHPETPGPWFIRYFHRIYDGDNNDDE